MLRYQATVSRALKALAAGLVLSLLLSVCGFAAECEDISERVLRLHILANSDSEEDQALKLKVRDAVLEAAQGLLDGTKDAEEAEARLKEQLPAIQKAAQQCVFQNGSRDAVTVSLCRMYFTTRCYETVTLPAGQYRALRITIGEGAGHNWWCVVFPPMCLSGASEQQELEDVLTEEETDIVTRPQQYEVRLKVVEWWNSLCQAFT